MLSFEVPNEPAGRLRTVLDQIRRYGDTLTVSEWWRRIAPEVVSGGDPISARSEAASLFRDVEQAVYSLPLADDRDAALAAREQWARPIFALGLVDRENGRLNQHQLVPDSALNSLAMLSSVLRREAPEYSLKAESDTVKEVLGSIYNEVASIFAEVSSLPGIPDAMRALLLRRLVRVMDDINFVRMRGFATLHDSLVEIQWEMATATVEPVVEAEPTLHDRLNNFLARLKTTVGMLEDIVTPTAIGVTWGITTGDVVGALVMAGMMRKMLAAGDTGAATQVVERLKRGELPKGESAGEPPSSDDPAT